MPNLHAAHLPRGARDAKHCMAWDAIEKGSLDLSPLLFRLLSRRWWRLPQRGYLEAYQDSLLHIRGSQTVMQCCKNDEEAADMNYNGVISNRTM